ncbi:radical SAM protein [Lachnospiraceae bacterium ZAX-1]
MSFFGSVTDAYNPFEKKYEKTRGILKQFIDTDAEIIIATKSKLVARDLDILKRIKRVTVAFSINTMDETFRRDMDRASTIQERVETMELLHSNGIYTVTFISPIFPEITDAIKIIDKTKDICDVFWLENLNLSGGYKNLIMKYIEEKYPEYREIYNGIYNKKNMTYWS